MPSTTSRPTAERCAARGARGRESFEEETRGKDQQSADREGFDPVVLDLGSDSDYYIAVSSFEEFIPHSDGEIVDYPREGLGASSRLSNRNGLQIRVGRERQMIKGFGWQADASGETLSGRADCWTRGHAVCRRLLNVHPSRPKPRRYFDSRATAVCSISA